MKTSSFLAVLILLSACQSTPAPPKMESVIVDSTHKTILRFDPPSGSAYTYHAVNETVYKMKINDQQINTGNITDLQYDYFIQKDTAEVFTISIFFRKIKVITDKDGTKTEADADNAALSVYPIEKMLGMLKDQKMELRIDGNGKVLSVKGYDEIGHKFIAQFADDDTYGRATAKTQWDQLVGNGLIKGQLNQMFKTLPGVEVYPGYSWTSKDKVEGDLPMNVESTMKIAEIDPLKQIVFLTESKLKNAGNTIANVPGARLEDASLSGTRTGITHINAQTGMIEKNVYTSKISGSIVAMGTIMPLTIDSKVTLEGKIK